jgi:hypothetical protein
MTGGPSSPQVLVVVEKRTEISVDASNRDTRAIAARSRRSSGSGEQLTDLPEPLTRRRNTGGAMARQIQWLSADQSQLITLTDAAAGYRVMADAPPA